MDTPTASVKQQAGRDRNWYAIHTYAGYENAVAKNLQQRVESLNMENFIFNVLVPMEKKIKIKGGKRVEVSEKIYPGYVLVDMTVTDDSWYVVRNTPNVTGFVGSGTIPVPVSPEEWKVIKRHMGQAEPKFKIDFTVGDNVIVLDGPFANYDGLISTIDEDKGRVKVLITIFGRETPVELEFTQVKKK